MTLRSPPALFAAALLAACAAPVSPSENAPPGARIVRIAAPAVIDAAEDLRGIGRLEADSEAALGFTSAGVIAAIDVDIGDPVRAGQTLARLDATVLDAEAREASEQVARAQRDVARFDDLAQRQLVAQRQRDDARTALQVAEARLRAARFSQRFGRLVAAADGTVLARLAEPGEVVAAGQPVLRVSGADRGWVLPVTLADRDGVRVREGHAASVRFDALPGRVLPATVTRVAGEASATSGGIVVELAIAGTDLPLRSGLVGKAAITTEGGARGLRIPASALVDATDAGATVFVVEQGVARRRMVRLGDVSDSGVEVLDGIAADDAVVVGGAASLEDGALVAMEAGP
jgi:RND family efflux transporter MFP subunit